MGMASTWARHWHKASSISIHLDLSWEAVCLFCLVSGFIANMGEEPTLRADLSLQTLQSLGIVFWVLQQACQLCPGGL
jgi:hypothetical protein